MKKFIRYLALLLSLFTLLTTPTLPVEASEDLSTHTDTPIYNIKSNTGGTEIEKEELEEQEYTIEGASPRRTGYLIWASDGSGLSNIYSPTSI